MPLIVQDIRSALMDCYDHEISINIVDLGLVYRIELVDDSTMPSSIPMLRVEVDMSLTTPGYPVSANPRSKWLEYQVGIQNASTRKGAGCWVSTRSL